MIPCCLQRCRADPVKGSRVPLSDVDQYSLSEDGECDSTRRVERPGFWKQSSNHLVIAVFLCLCFRVLLNAITGFTFLALVNGQTLKRGNDTYEYVQYVEWSFQGRSMMRSVYQYGMPTLEVVGGIVAVRCGHPRMFGVGVAATSLAAVLAPVVFRASCDALVWLLFAARVLDALLARNLELVWGRRVPAEKSWLLAFCYSGLVWGDLVTNPLVLWKPDLLAAPPLHYVMGSVGLLMCAVWWTAVRRVRADSGATSSQTHGRRFVFCHVVMSLPVLALVIAVKANIWSLATVDISLFRYLTDELQYEYLSLEQQSAALLVLYVFIFITTVETASTKVVRKGLVCLPLVVNGGLMFLCLYVRSPTAMMAVATTVHVCSAIAYNTSLVNVFDIAPRFSPAIVGVLMATASACSTLAASTVQYFTQENNVDEWKKMLFVSGGAALAAAFIYLIFGSVRVQKWAAEDDEEPSHNDEEA